MTSTYLYTPLGHLVRDEESACYVRFQNGRWIIIENAQQFDADDWNLCIRCHQRTDNLYYCDQCSDDLAALDL